jgi:hypothetical protein
MNAAEHPVQRRRARRRGRLGANAERRGVEEVNFTFDGHRSNGTVAFAS